MKRSTVIGAIVGAPGVLLMFVPGRPPYTWIAFLLLAVSAVLITRPFTKKWRFGWLLSFVVAPPAVIVLLVSISAALEVATGDPCVRLHQVVRRSPVQTAEEMAKSYGFPKGGVTLQQAVKGYREQCMDTLVMLENRAAEHGMSVPDYMAKIGFDPDAPAASISEPGSPRQ